MRSAPLTRWTLLFAPLSFPPPPDKMVDDEATNKQDNEGTYAKYLVPHVVISFVRLVWLRFLCFYDTMCEMSFVMVLLSGFLSGSAILACAVLFTDVSHFLWFSLGSAVSFAVSISLLFAPLRLVRASNGKLLSSVTD